jgi:hypothetical protein
MTISNSVKTKVYKWKILILTLQPINKRSIHWMNIWNKFSRKQFRRWIYQKKGKKEKLLLSKILWLKTIKANKLKWLIKQNSNNNNNSERNFYKQYKTLIKLKQT